MSHKIGLQMTNLLRINYFTIFLEVFHHIWAFHHNNCWKRNDFVNCWTTFLGDCFWNTILSNSNKLTLLNYVPHASSRLTCLRTSAPYPPYTFSCFKCFLALRAFVPYPPLRLRGSRALLTHFIYTPCTPSLRVLPALSTHFCV